MKQKIKNILHTELTLKGGGTVLVLNTDATISPEAEAMLQALHSRSIGGIRSHLEVLQKKGSDAFMSTFYVGYGHKSIGDCGSATVFVEGISLLAAKAIQDWPLFSGQESSTRYINFENQPFLNPLGSTEGKNIQAEWRRFYKKGISELTDVLEERFPRKDTEDETLYNKAIDARTFDIMRAFLPVGVVTNVAWHMNLRQFSDALLQLRHHPLQEVQTIALGVEKALLEAYPNSFSTKRYAETETYYASIMKQYYYEDATCPDFELSKNNIDPKILKEYKKALTYRPAKAELPRTMAECGSLQYRFTLDWGGYKDLQRHRAVTQRMPLLTLKHGFHPWYLDELSPSLKKEALELIKKQKKAIRALKAPKEVTQYYIAKGFMLPNRLTGDLRTLMYIAELRSTRFVHPTLRARAQQIALSLKDICKASGITLSTHLDTEPDRFDIQRGTHDIVEKK